VVGAYLNKRIAIMNVNPTNYNFLKNAMSFIIFTLAIILVFNTVPELRHLGTTLFASAGIFAAVLAFASQQAMSNVIGGIFIVIFKPFRVGDVIQVRTDFGTVEDITLRHTMLKNFQNERVIIPNSVISSEFITNRTIVDERFRRAIDIGVSFDSDLDLAIEIILKLGRNHPNYIDWRTEADVDKGAKDIDVKILEFTETGIMLRAFIWSDTAGKSFDLMSDILYSVKKEFDQNNIVIARPARYVINK
jgi:small-conductance mechanosensitive channel